MRPDPHEKPPEYLKQVFKTYQNLSVSDIENVAGLVDFNTRSIEDNQTPKLWKSSYIDGETINDGYKTLLHWLPDLSEPSFTHKRVTTLPDKVEGEISCFSIEEIPGLEIIPNLISLDVQREVLSRIFHRDLSNPNHKTNIHLHYNISYPPDEGSFFTLPKHVKDVAQPIDPTAHKPFSMQQFLDKKLRWITLGGQYDWTEKVYPKENPPKFPEDLAYLLKVLFPSTKSEAAIVNLYSPGDTLSLHRDLSEESSQGLISVSIGCEALFMIALENDNGLYGYDYAVIRLRSGDVVYMSGRSRFAWHGVPKVITRTCPEALKNWPYEDPDHCNDYGANEGLCPWKGWMSNKRINLNVRQMWDD